MDDQTIGTSIAAAALKVSPAAAVVAAQVSGMTLQQWMYAATILYCVVQSAYLVAKWVRERREK